MVATIKNAGYPQNEMDKNEPFKYKFPDICV
jgi:hypothetical protein